MLIRFLCLGFDAKTLSSLVSRFDDAEFESDDGKMRVGVVEQGLLDLFINDMKVQLLVESSSLCEFVEGWLEETVQSGIAEILGLVDSADFIYLVQDESNGDSIRHWIRFLKENKPGGLTLLGHEEVCSSESIKFSF